MATVTTGPPQCFIAARPPAVSTSFISVPPWTLPRMFDPVMSICWLSVMAEADAGRGARSHSSTSGHSYQAAQGRRRAAPVPGSTDIPTSDPRRGPSSALEQVAGDDHPLDLVRPLVDLGDLRVAHHALHRVLAHVAVASEHLDRVGGDLHRHV